ncbi:MAG: hypothetical protein A2913_00580 [Parcubacteria group bacterium RIFCSPLOWO2_01_FULL_40_65]|nr:MAG: hypothetical protein A2734_02020 [Parcubacteria group bacterium RIFCSPHIGHO2_01_FULL_40_30]OHB19550.1 MAG: hypothetical protein A3D40_00900 [Parcubacteria group bacterium RIFCSPHIGHO2_02_FULL_40_12]OHB21090.1 MAG: hypothetical protein A2913_00580 [Parcubacteria group bacterium RIFCSPLOWO2_01_FULL_40_65]OHB22711.1 MAG: hypothetical protein A3I22_02335 [Parcubacteria group bacterium RIFCSPLOWO2_02_FULL_40_12]OHB24218.1 MAG: hypothetical protein A3F96_01915 [Parcubacteria group bacterium R
MKIKKNQIKLRLRWFEYFKKQKNISKTCRYFGISRQTYYKWLKRYINDDKETLLDLSKKPKNIKYKITPEIKKIIKELRINRFFGAFKISRYLKNNKNFDLGPASINKTLRKMKINRLKLVKKLIKT